jgi:ankyrin repeat protein
VSTIAEFLDAAAIGDAALVEKMLKADPALATAADDMGFTALHTAVGEDNPEVLQLLIKAGADVSATNDYEMTPLHIAQFASAVQTLVANGAEVNARARGGMTPLLVQAAEGYDTGSLESMEALLKAGADPNARDDDGETAIDYARSRQEGDKVALLQRFGATG